MTRISRTLWKARMKSMKRYNKRRSGQSNRLHTFHHREIVELLLDVSFLIVLFYLISTHRHKAKQILDDIQISSENTLSWAFLVTVQGILDVSSTLCFIINLVYGFVAVVVELGQTTLVPLLWIITWSCQLLKSITVTCLAHFTAAFTFLENIVPFRIISGIIAIVLGLWVWKLIKTNAKISEDQKILVSNLENGETLLKIEKKQHDATKKELKKVMLESERKEREISTLNSQNNKSNLKIEEFCKKNKDLQTNKLLLKLQKEKSELSMKKAEKQNEGLSEDKQNLKSQIMELNMTLKKAEKQNLIFKEDTLRVQSENKNLNLQLDKEKDEKLCVACVDKDKKILLQPCNHLCLCEKCLAHKKWTECPVCRQHIKSTIDVYV